MEAAAAALRRIAAGTRHRTLSLPSRHRQDAGSAKDSIRGTKLAVVAASNTEKNRTMQYSPVPLQRTPSWSFAEICRQLKNLQKSRLPVEPDAGCICIGLENPQGIVSHVVRTTRLVDAVKVMELLVNAGWVPAGDGHYQSDEALVMRVYRRRR